MIDIYIRCIVIIVDSRGYIGGYGLVYTLRALSILVCIGINSYNSTNKNNIKKKKNHNNTMLFTKIRSFISNMVSAETTILPPKTKKVKIDSAILKDSPLVEAPDNEWPEAWIMPDEVEDQKALNKLEPNIPVSVSHLRKIGIS